MAHAPCLFTSLVHRLVTHMTFSKMVPRKYFLEYCSYVPMEKVSVDVIALSETRIDITADGFVQF